MGRKPNERAPIRRSISHYYIIENKWFDVQYPLGEFGEHFEGDMLLTKSQREAITEASDPDSRNGLRDVAKRWPNRTVVYYIEEEHFGLLLSSYL